MERRHGRLGRLHPTATVPVQLLGLDRTVQGQHHAAVNLLKSAHLVTKSRHSTYLSVIVRLDSPACLTTLPTHGSKTMKCPATKKPYR